MDQDKDLTFIRAIASLLEKGRFDLEGKEMKPFVLCQQWLKNKEAELAIPNAKEAKKAPATKKKTTKKKAAKNVNNDRSAN